MADNPTLIVIAAGMGTRYGGLKQMDSIGEHGEVIVDYSIYDAIAAGFSRVIFVLKKENIDIFKSLIGDRISKHISVEYVCQCLHDLPIGYNPPKDRIKPWGTAHAVLAARHLIDDSFVVINADDYYGRNCFASIYNFLVDNKNKPNEKYNFAMVGYKLENTLTENGFVSRGVCEIDENNYLIKTNERTRIEKDDKCARYLDENNNYINLDFSEIVSMNLFGFTKEFMIESFKEFKIFLDQITEENELIAEFGLPTAVSKLIDNNLATMKIIESMDKWYGVTYKEDKERVVEAMRNKHLEGVYPTPLWK